MVSQQDVADKAGVSLATASLALNNHPRVAARTRARVQAVARGLGYVANHAARQLVRARYGRPAAAEINQVGFVVCASPAHPNDARPLIGTYMGFVQGVEQEIAARNGLLVFLRENGDQLPGRLAALNRSGTVEGWILTGDVTDDSARLVDALHRPWVALGDYHCSRPVHAVNVDFRAMGRLAAQHLVALGHRRIGYVGSAMRFTYEHEILAGFRDALQAAGLALDPAALITREAQDSPRGFVAAAMERCLALSPRPTAFVYGEAGESELVLAWAAHRGIRMPDDLSVLFCELSDGPPFATDSARVEASASETGRAAVPLLEEVARYRNAPVRQVFIAPRVVPGRTAGGIGQSA